MDKHSEEEDRQNAGADKALKLLDEGECAAELRVAHKTEAGGVKIDLSSADEVSRAVAQMSQLSETFLIEKMVENVVAELIVGVARDDQFGPYLLVGGGGILVEMMKDSASLLLPVTGERVLEALRGLKCAPLLHGLRDDPELRVAILTGAGEKFFSGGWDLNAVAAGEEYLGDYREGGFGGFPEMTDLLKPVICAVNGLAVGAGFEMLLRADFVIAAEHAQFMFPEVRIGVAPDVGIFMLPKLLPRQKALEILMSGRRFDARELAGFGLVNEVVPADQLMERARVLAEDLCRAAPLALAAVKEAVQMTENLSFEESYAALRSKSWPAFMKMLESSDSQEGARAFVEKRGLSKRLLRTDAVQAGDGPE